MSQQGLLLLKKDKDRLRGVQAALLALVQPGWVCEEWGSKPQTRNSTSSPVSTYRGRKPLPRGCLLTNLGICSERLKSIHIKSAAGQAHSISNLVTPNPSGLFGEMVMEQTRLGVDQTQTQVQVPPLLRPSARRSLLTPIIDYKSKNNKDAPTPASQDHVTGGTGWGRGPKSDQHAQNMGIPVQASVGAVWASK